MEIPRLLILKADAPRVAPQPAEPESPPPEVVELVPEVVELVPELIPEPEAPRMGTADQIEEAEKFAKAGVPMKLVDPERPHVSHLVGPDLSNPEVWRHSEMVNQEPWSEQEFAKAEDAFLAALRAGGIPQHTDACSDEA